VGQLIPGTKLKIIDIKTGASLPAYKIGEICVKSNQLTPGYLTGPFDEQKTSIFTKDGFFRTSDAGYYDNDGYLYIESKLSDMICIEEEVFSPKEIEILLLSHSDVIDATVIGIFLEDDYEDKSETLDHNLSNTFKAFVVLRAGSDTNDLDLINYVNDRVEPIKQFDSGIFILDVLPRNCMGIINKSSLIKT
jgi:fatty-acyl-CoA synthase